MLAKKELQQNNHHHHHHHANDTTKEEPMDTSDGNKNLHDGGLDGSQNSLEDDFEDVYGELVVLGFNGVKPQHWLIHSSSAARRDLCTKYRLRRRYQPNGVISSQRMKQCPSSEEKEAVRSRKTHSISYMKSKSECYVEEYLHDDFTDLFQVGRSTERPIDFTIRDYWPTLSSSQGSQSTQFTNNKSASVDSGESASDAAIASNFRQPTVPGSKQPVNSKMSVTAPPPPQPTTESTISRFACRIIVNRTRPFQPRIFAAGFDNDNNIFLGEKAIKWTNDVPPVSSTSATQPVAGNNNGAAASFAGALLQPSTATLDALTTNGVLIMKPQGTELWQENVQPGTYWREISVCGAVSAVRPARSSKDRGQAKLNETNILTDGTMIDLCGVTLLYRSPEGLLKSPKLDDLENCLAALNAGRPQCPVGLNTLVIPKQKAHGAGSRTERDPYAYLPCGHIQGRHPWGKQPNHLRRCPMCFREGKAIRVCMGMEPAFYVGASLNIPDHAFIPCGHITSRATVQYWSRVMVPLEATSFRPSTPVCPFCGTALDKKQPFVRLIYQTETEMT